LVSNTRNGNKYYFTSRVRVLDTTDIVSLLLQEGAGAVGGVAIETLNSVVQNQWYILSGVVTQTLNANPYNADIRVTYTSAATSDGKQFQINYFYTFNITNMIANKQYSPLYATTFDLMTDAQIKAQMDSWIADGTLPNDGIANVEKPSVTAVGKNLFDLKQTYTAGGLLSDGTIPSSGSTYSVNDDTLTITQVSAFNGIASDFINLKSNTDYRFSFTSSTFGIRRIVGYETSTSTTGTEVMSSLKTSNFTFNTGSFNYFRMFLQITTGTSPFTVSVSNIQLEEGTTSTTYEPYKSSTLTIDTELRSLPNGVRDRMYEQNGEVWLEKRVEEVVLQSANIINYANYTNIGQLEVDLSSFPFTVAPQDISVADGSFIIDGKPLELGSQSSDAVGFENAFKTSSTKIFINFPLNTYANNTEAQADFAGTVVQYQLATPQLINLTQEGKVNGELIAFENGTIYNTSDTFHADISFDVASNRSAQISGLLESASYQAKQIDTKASKVQEDWIEPTLLNGWVNYDIAEHRKVGFYKDEFDVVHLKGMIKDGTTTSNTNLFVLPLGYRLDTITYFPTFSNNILGGIKITALGEVQFRVGSNIWFSLDGISFKVGE
jgi:hypothetical protein